MSEAGGPGEGAPCKSRLQRPRIGALPEPFAGWFAARGWQPRAHQLALLDKVGEGRDTLLIAPTGGGKTLAGFLPSLVDLSARPLSRTHPSAAFTRSMSRH